MKSVYIHIPFCKKICSYCDFCKLLYDYFDANKYLEQLYKEIKEKYQNEIISTIYIGGGTPSCLSIEELNNLFKIIKIFRLNNDYEFTFECNIESIDEEKLNLLYKNGVNRLSIGVQTFNDKHLKGLNRNHFKKDIVSKINLAKIIGFNNINIDLMYGFSNQTIEELKKDLKEFININIEHISIYSLIVEEHTKIYNDNVITDDDLTAEMYDYICSYLKEKGYKHYEISNFSKKGYESKHNLTYWNNDEYYGFGLGASGYINGIRYENTRSLTSYLKGIYLLNSHILTKKEKMENEIILGLRKIDGIDRNIFFQKYGEKIEDIFNVDPLINQDLLVSNNKSIYIKEDKLFLSNEILQHFI